MLDDLNRHVDGPMDAHGNREGKGMRVYPGGATGGGMDVGWEQADDGEDGEGE